AQLDGPRLALRGRDRHGLVEKGKLARARLETHESAGEIARRVDLLAARKPRQHVRRPVPIALAHHLDETAARLALRIARVELDDAVVACNLPVRAGKDFAAQQRALEGAARV